METFSLLKYWRTGGATVFGSGAGGTAPAGAGNFKRPPVATTTIVAPVTNNVVDTTSQSQEDDNDDGPFFDLKFTVPEEEEEEEVRKVKTEDVNFNGGGCDDDEEENADTVSGGDDDDDVSESAEEGEYNESVDSCAEEVVSPSDLFFEENLVPIEHSELELEGSEANSRPQFHVSLLKSATKLRIFMLGLAKSKSTEKPSTEIDGSAIAAETRKKENVVEDEEKNSINNKQRKLLMVKFKVDEVPFISLFTRDTSSRNIDKNNNNKDEAEHPDEKKFSKDVMHKYINKVKPLYVRVSKRYGEKLKFSGQLSNGTGVKRLSPQLGEKVEVKSTEVMVSQKQGNLSAAAGMRVVRKHLGKSRSSSSLVAADPLPAKPKRRDDSLLEQHDGIQGAILHCKRSFNASRDSES